MKYLIYKIIKIIDKEEKVVLSTNDKEFALDELNRLLRQSSDEEFYILIED